MAREIEALSKIAEEYLLKTDVQEALDEIEPITTLTLTLTLIGGSR